VTLISVNREKIAWSLLLGAIKLFPPRLLINCRFFFFVCFSFDENCQKLWRKSFFIFLAHFLLMLFESTLAAAAAAARSKGREGKRVNETSKAFIINSPKISF
jgi:hypothetical protein